MPCSPFYNAEPRINNRNFHAPIVRGLPNPGEPRCARRDQDKTSKAYLKGAPVHACAQPLNTPGEARWRACVRDAKTRFGRQ